jgi:hypothetical protein
MTQPLPPPLQQSLDYLGRLYARLERTRASAVHPSLRQAAEDGIGAEITKVQQSLNAKAGVRVDLDADVVVRVVPAEALPQDFHSSHLIVPQIDGIRLSIQTVSGYLERGYIAKRPKRELVSACDVGIDWVSGGSVRVGLSLPRPDAQDVHGPHITRAAHLVVHALEWIGREGADAEFASAIPDAALRAVVLAEVARMAPAKRGAVQSIEYSGRQLDSVARLDRTTGEWIQAAITRLGAAPVEEVEGVVRMVDLDRQVVVIKTDEGRRVRCELPADSLGKAALGARLTVTGQRPLHRGRPASVLQVTSVVEALDEEDEV